MSVTAVSIGFPYYLIYVGLSHSEALTLSHEHAGILIWRLRWGGGTSPSAKASQARIFRLCDWAQELPEVV